MSWEQIAIIAQICTGGATLIVALFLAAQIRLQMRALDRAHEDAERQEDTLGGAKTPGKFARTCRTHLGGCLFVARALRDALDEPDSSFPLALLLVRGALVRMGGGLGLERAHGEVRLILAFAAA